MTAKLLLQGIRIHLSGSVPEDATGTEAAEVLQFVRKFTAAVLREGGILVHGSHPTFQDPLREAAQQFVDAGGRLDGLTLVRSHRFSRTTTELGEIEAQRKFAAVHLIPEGDSPDGLVGMREWLAERCDATVAVGGKWYSSNKTRAGVPKELEEMLARGKPAFVVAGFGGAVRGYIADDPSVLSRLHNGLSADSNRDIASSRDVDSIVASIVSQLKLLPFHREPASSGRHFRILALDGGGLRGSFTAAVLAKWEAMLGGAEGHNLVKHFDLVAGTSTGAIIAIGLGLGHTPSELLSFYRDQGPRIFPKDRKLRHWLKSKHDSSTLRGILEAIFGDRKLSEDSCCRLVIPTVRAKHGETEVIVTAHHPDRTAFRSISAVDAAIASTAAPTYFDEAFVDDTIAVQSYLDGGIWANNPVLPAIAEALRHLKVPLDRIDVLSVGTIGNESDFSEALGRGKAGWAPHSADLFFAAQEHAASRLADSLLSRARHLRVNQLAPTAIRLDDTEAIADMIDRGADVAKDTFASVRSRFLDGFLAADWRTEDGK